jgi:hypothetical protein
MAKAVNSQAAESKGFVKAELSTGSALVSAQPGVGSRGVQAAPGIRLLLWPKRLRVGDVHESCGHQPSGAGRSDALVRVDVTVIRTASLDFRVLSNPDPFI